MKFNKVVIAALTGTGIFLASCLNEKQPVVEEIPPEPEPVETLVSGKILSRKADLYLFGRDSKMHPLLKLYAGNDISVLEIDSVIDTKFVPDKNSLATAGAAEASETTNTENAENAQPAVSGTEYVHVVHDNLDFWLDKSVFALNCETAVAIEKTFLYPDAELTQKLYATPNPLKFASMIAVASQENNTEPENSAAPQKSDSAESASVKIFYYDTDQKSVRDAYVQTSSISARIDDIIVSQIAEDLKVTKKAVPRNELFARAAKYKPCAKVLAALNAQKVETKTYNYQEVLKSMQRMTFGVNVDELMTVDQSKDPFK